MTTATINVTLRLDKNLKEQADEFFNNLGLSLNSAINMFIKQSLRERQLPFLPSLNTPNAETRAALDEADRMLKDPYLKTYSVDDLLTELKNNAPRHSNIPISQRLQTRNQTRQRHSEVG